MNEKYRDLPDERFSSGMTSDEKGDEEETLERMEVAVDPEEESSMMTVHSSGKDEMQLMNG